MKFIRGLVITIIVLLVLLVAGSFLLPSEAQFTRSVEIQRPVGQVFEVLNGFGHFNEWSPWAGLDPDANYQYEGPATGVGATMRWQGDPASVGSGSQEIIAVQEQRRIEVALAFAGQNPAHSWYELTPADGGTEVTWGFRTELGNNPINRYFGLLLESWVGSDYERGLEQLKAYLEQS